MSNLIDRIRDRIAELSDSSNPYSQEDFNKEFSGASTVTFNNDPYKIGVGFSNKSNNPDPEYATDGASGFDLRAFVDQPIILKPEQYHLIPTGLYFEIPDNFEIQVRARSGLAYKYGVTVLNGIGTIDSDYRGPLGVILINHGDEDFTINNGDRIAQAVVSSVTAKNVIKLNKLTEVSTNTQRGSDGFGSTGLK